MVGEYGPRINERNSKSRIAIYGFSHEKNYDGLETLGCTIKTQL